MAATRQNPALIFASIAHFFSHVMMLLFPTVVLALENVFGMTYGELIELALPGFLLFGVAALPAGWIADRWSANGMMALFFIGTGGGAVMTGFADRPLHLAIGLGLIGLFASIYHPVGTAFLVRHAESRGRALGINGVFGSLGIAMAALIAGILTDLIHWRAAFILPGIVCAMTGVAFLVVMREDRQPKRASLPAHAFVLNRQQARRGLLALAATALSVGTIGQVFMVGVPKVMDVRVTLFEGAEIFGGLFGGLVGTSLIATLVFMFGAAGQLVGGGLADRFPLKRVYLGMYVIMLPIALIAAGVGNLAIVGACAMMMMLNTGSLPIENSLVSHYCPPEWHGTAYGAKFVLSLGVASLGVPLVGSIYDTTGGFYWLFVCVAGLAAIVILCGWRLPSVSQVRVQSVPESTSESTLRSTAAEQAAK